MYFVSEVILIHSGGREEKIVLNKPMAIFIGAELDIKSDVIGSWTCIIIKQIEPSVGGIPRLYFDVYDADYVKHRTVCNTPWRGATCAPEQR